MANAEKNEVWNFIQKILKQELGGKIFAEPPKHGYKLFNNKLEKAAIFVELKSNQVGNPPEEFRRFYILRYDNTCKFCWEIGKTANLVNAELQYKRGEPVGLNCDMHDWANWKAGVMAFLSWAWMRTE